MCYPHPYFIDFFIDVYMLNILTYINNSLKKPTLKKQSDLLNVRNLTVFNFRIFLLI